MSASEIGTTIIAVYGIIGILSAMFVVARSKSGFWFTTYIAIAAILVWPLFWFAAIATGFGKKGEGDD